MISYRIQPADVRRHHFIVECRISDAGASESFRIPSWIPGSYLLREFSRHVVAVQASSNGSPVDVRKTDNSTWQCTGASGELVLTLVIYAHDRSVRGAYVDDTRAYFNGACVFPYVLERTNEPIELRILSVTEAVVGDWRVATAMKPVSVDSRGFGLYCADDYDELIDHPVEISDFGIADFDVRGRPHRLVIAGRHTTDLERIGRDLSRLCSAQIDFFGDAPFDNYTFLGLAVANGYGGLEHRASSSLVFNRNDLPAAGQTKMLPEYQRFLALCSHEYFHAWHIKQTKPAAFVPYRLNERNYTRLLWVFEGITSYYQDVFLLRSGLISASDYLRRLAESLSRVYRTPGRLTQSIAASSYDAWDGLYKPEPNSVNAAISYYSKGALVSLALDLTLRSMQQALSLDEVVRELWQRFGRAGRGVDEKDFEELVIELAGEPLMDFFEQAVRGTEDLPLADLLEKFGVQLEYLPWTGEAGPQSSALAPRRRRLPLWLGATWRASSLGLEITAVLDDGPLQLSGFAPGDTLIAIDGLRVMEGNLLQRLDRYGSGDRVSVSAFRDDELITRQVVLATAPTWSCRLAAIDEPDGDAAARRKAWLGV